MNNEGENALFTWKVFEEYIEEERLVPKPGVILPDDPEHYQTEIFFSGKGESKEYYPTEHANLWTEFQRIDNKKSALEFIRRFGIPSEPEETNLEYVLGEAKCVRECLRLYKAIKEKLPIQDIELWELFFKDSFNQKKKLARFTEEKIKSMEIEKWTEIVIDTSRSIRKDRTQEQGREALMEHINKRLKGVSPILLYKDNNFTFGQTCNDLIQFVYLQIYENITQKKKFVQCQKCHSWFVPTKAGMKFCPPLRYEARSHCANQVYVSENEQRKKIKERLKKGLSLNEAAADYDMEKVQEWLKKGLI